MNLPGLPRSERVAARMVCEPCDLPTSARTVRFVYPDETTGPTVCNCGRTMEERDRMTEAEWTAVAEARAYEPTEADIARMKELYEEEGQ